MAESSPAIENLFSEGRTFPPPDGFKADALVTYRSLHEQAEQDLEGFWAEEAERLHWTRPWDQVLEWDLPFAKWFVGVQRGDRVNIYMGMVPELPVAMLACARLGAAHSVVFGGFSADSLRDRINDAEAKVLITQDEGWRAGKVVPLKKNADDAVADTPSIEKVVVLRRTGNDVAWTEGRDVWWHDLVEGQSTDCPPEAMDAEDLLYLLYTSGTTAKPKGIMHTTGGDRTAGSTTPPAGVEPHPHTHRDLGAGRNWRGS